VEDFYTNIFFATKTADTSYPDGSRYLAFKKDPLRVGGGGSHGQHSAIITITYLIDCRAAS
jgi:predicted enzyme related to lactoylglutathione lyase